MLRSRNEKNIMTYVPSYDLNLYDVLNVHITLQVIGKLQKNLICTQSDIYIFIGIIILNSQLQSPHPLFLRHVS